MIKGDRVIAKTDIQDINWKGRGLAEAGSKGTIIGKLKGCYAVKWDNGNTTWKVLPESIDYSKSDRKIEKNEQHVYRREFWKTYEGLVKLSEETFEPGERRDCFANARKWAWKNDNGNTFVVHGKITNIENKVLDHAWVEQNNDVIDPTQGVRVEKNKWYELVKAQPEAKYTPHQATINAIRSGKLGPWFPHEVEDRYVWRSDKGENPKKPLRENTSSDLVQRDEDKSIEPVPKKEEKEVVDYILKKYVPLYAQSPYPHHAELFKKTFRKIHIFPDGAIAYKADINKEGNSYFIISKHRIGVGFTIQDTYYNQFWPWEPVIHGIHSKYAFQPRKIKIDELFEDVKRKVVFKQQDEDKSVLPVSKKEEQQVVQSILTTYTQMYMNIENPKDAEQFRKSFRKVHLFPDGSIVYASGVNECICYFIISKHKDGVGYSIRDVNSNFIWKWESVIHTSGGQSIQEGMYKNGSLSGVPISKQQEAWSLRYLLPFLEIHFSKHSRQTLKKIRQDQYGIDYSFENSVNNGEPMKLRLRQVFDNNMYYWIGRPMNSTCDSVYVDWTRIPGIAPAEKPLNESEEENKKIDLTVSRKEEQEAIHKIVQRHPMFHLPEARQNLKKLAHRKMFMGGRDLDDIRYRTQYGDVTGFVDISKIEDGMIYRTVIHDKGGGKLVINSQPWDYVDGSRAELGVGQMVYESTDAPGYHGKKGAGAIILSKKTGRILLPYRSQTVHQPHTWGTWGGAVQEGENPASAMRREILEEIGENIRIDELIPLYVYHDHNAGFEFYNYLAIVPDEFTPKLNWENEKAEWFKYGAWPRPMHFGLKILLDRSSEIIKAEVKKYMKDPALIKTQKMDRLKFKAACDLINKVWANMRRGDAFQSPKDRFDYGDVSMWLLNEAPTQELLDYYGHQFYPFAHEPAYEFLEDVERALEELELRYNRRVSRYIDPADPLYVLKKLVKNKSWEKAKYDLAKFSLSGPLVSDRTISDEEAEEIFPRLFLNAMGETFYNPSNFHNTPRLDTLDVSNRDEAIRNFLRYYLPRNATKFPDRVKIYRGTNSPLSKIRPGDFCTFDKDYARSYIRGKYGAVARDTLPTHDLLLYKLDPGQSEFIYWPEGHSIQKYSGEIPKFKDFFLQNR